MTMCAVLMLHGASQQWEMLARKAKPISDDLLD